MVSKLQEYIDAEKVFFGMRECSRNAKKLGKIFVANDIRQEMMKELESHKVEIERLDMTRVELAEKLELDFLCEVFGVKK